MKFQTKASVLGLGLLSGSALGAVTAHDKHHDSLNQIESVLYLAKGETDILNQSFPLLSRCEPMNSLYKTCELPYQTNLLKFKLPAAYWSTESRLKIVSNLSGFEAHQTFEILGLPNACVLTLGPAKESICQIPGVPTEYDPVTKEATLVLKVKAPDLVKLSEGSSRVVVDKFAEAKITRVLLNVDSKNLIGDMRKMGETLEADARDSLSSIFAVERIADAATYDQDSLEVLYTTLSNAKSVGNKAMALNGSTPLAGYPLNRIMIALDSYYVDENGKDILGLCGMPYTSHSNLDCFVLDKISKLRCVEGTEITVDPITFEVFESGCSGIQGDGQKAIADLLKASRDRIDSLIGLFGRLESIQKHLGEEILPAKDFAIKARLETYEKAYRIHLAIKRYELDMRQPLAPDVGLEALLNAQNSTAGGSWNGPYLTDASHLQDGWGQAFVLAYKSVSNQSVPSLTSSGFDKELGNSDDQEMLNGGIAK